MRASSWVELGKYNYYINICNINECRVEQWVTKQDEIGYYGEFVSIPFTGTYFQCNEYIDNICLDDEGELYDL